MFATFLSVWYYLEQNARTFKEQLEKLPELVTMTFSETIRLMILPRCVPYLVRGRFEWDLESGIAKDVPVKFDEPTD